MPLGSARDFGVDNGPGEPEPEFQGRIRDLRDEVAATEAENLGPDVHDDPEGGDENAARFGNPFEGVEVGEYLGGETAEGSPEEMAQLMAYLNMMQPQYAVTPADLVSLTEAGIIERDEARAYLASHGVIG